MKKTYKVIFTGVFAGIIYFSGLACFVQAASGANFAERPANGTSGKGMQLPGGLKGEAGRPSVSTEAIEACEDSSGNDTCSFVGLVGDSSSKISGTCRKSPKKDSTESSELACMPEMKDRGEEKGAKMLISDEAVEACDDESEKDTCSYTSADSSVSVSGICVKNPNDSAELFCAVERSTGNREGDSIEKAKKMKEMKEVQVAKIEEYVERIIDFLKLKDIDTDEIESSLEIFKEKAETMLSAIDTYIDALDNDDNDATKDARENVKTTISAMTNYFNETLKTEIKSALDKIDD